MIINDIIGQIKDGNKNYRDFSILYRTHAVSRSLIEQLVIKEILLFNIKQKIYFITTATLNPLLMF